MDYPKHIMVVGNGGRECALANACLLSPRLERLVITPPNWGVIDPVGGRVMALGIKVDESNALIAAAREHAIDLVIIGPENPLCDGLADEFRAAGFAVVGVGRETAQLEGSKAFAKQFMHRHGIPTAAMHEFNDADELLKHIEQTDSPVVVKADGLAAGKGVIVCSTRDEALEAARRIAVDKQFGAAGDKVLVEERLVGPEISWTCLISGDRAELLGVSTDYKPLLDGNQGPNTGGMGNICPTPFAPPAVVEEFYAKILAPFMAGLGADGLDYRGMLFIGSMLTDTGLKVIEFNTRMGDPEAQVVMPMNVADWPAVFAGVASGEWSELPKLREDAACVAVVVASGNYPYGKSEPVVIEGLDRIHARGLLSGDDPPVSLYFAGVSREATAAVEFQNYYDSLGSARFLATGGRVLAVSARGKDLSDARRLAYEVVGNLHFEGMQFRGDIGRRD